MLCDLYLDKAIFFLKKIHILGVAELWNCLLETVLRGSECELSHTAGYSGKNIGQQS